MIAFGSSITVPEVFERCADPGIQRAAEPGSERLIHAAAGSLARTYNLMLDQAASHDDLEALVLLHQDAEIVDPGFCARVRGVLSDPEVAVVGCVGATGVRSIAWWEGEVTWTSSAYRYGELGGGDLLPRAGAGNVLPAQGAPGPVDTLYGFVLVLAPWTVRELRFDEGLGLRHGYDFDLCLQARSAGRTVVATDLGVVHHHSLELIGDFELWAEAHMNTAEKWDGRIPGEPAAVEWKDRARRAEAEAAAARLQAASKLLQAYAGAQMNDDRLERMTASPSWRITGPLRRINDMRRRMPS